jgi:ABC-type Zn uptake system ZnuABC Zn-binding protein ZnuA
MRSETWKLLAVVCITLLMLAAFGACGPATPESGQEHGHEAEHAHDHETEHEGEHAHEHETEHEHHSDAAELEAVSLAAGEKLKVVATTNIVGDVVRNVGGDQIDLKVLMGIGVDPHTYVTNPADTVAIHDAHVVFANGAGLEANLEEMLENAGGDAVHVHVSHGLDFHPPPGGHKHDEQAAHGGTEGEDGHEHGDVDPHVWFSVPNVIHWVGNVEQALSALNPSSAGVYEENAHAYIHELEELDAWIQSQISQVPEANRKLVTNHPAFGYFADRYGLEQVGAIYPVNPSSEPSAQDIAALADAIREYGVPAVFAESTVNPSLAEQVARDTGVKLVPLYTGSLSEPGDGAETYILLMRYDVNAIVEALE